jgi:predicted nucleic-acid-binding Zn-ribbon protein
MRPVTWRTDEPCPSCGAPMFLLDDGLPVLNAECRLCGYGETWDTDSHDFTGGDNE